MVAHVVWPVDPRPKTGLSGSRLRKPLQAHVCIRLGMQPPGWGFLGGVSERSQIAGGKAGEWVGFVVGFAKTDAVDEQVDNSQGLDPMEAQPDTGRVGNQISAHSRSR